VHRKDKLFLKGPSKTQKAIRRDWK